MSGDVILFPLSFAQQRLWFLDQLTPGKPFYNLPAAVRFRAPLDAGALERGVNEIVRRHEVLRTCFAVVNGEPMQQVLPTLTVPFLITNLGLPPGPEREARVQQLAAEEAHKPFDLERGPLLRTALLDLGDEFVFLLTMHHIVSDDWSIQVFLSELATFYAAFSEGKPSPLAELPIQYADFAVWQREWMQGSALETQLVYWKTKLAGISSLDMPAQRSRPAIPTFRGRRHPINLSKDLLDGLRALAHGERATLFMVLLAAFQTLIFRYTGQEDICIGCPAAGRSRAETENLIGFFVNTLVMRADLSGNPNFLELLARVRETALEAYANQDVPFEKLVQELQPVRDLSRNPLFQVMFALQNAPAATGSGLSAKPIEAEITWSNFDLALVLWETPGGVRGRIEYSTDLFDTREIVRLAGHYRLLLEGIVAGPGRHVSSLPLLSPAESNQILRDWNQTRADYPNDICLDRLFEEQAARRPDALAVASGEQRLSYAELDRRADEIAAHLRTHGVGPEIAVAVCLDRSIELVAAMLAIWKAGGAFVPLDPESPAERLALMLRDSGSSVLLTCGKFAAALPAFDGCVVYLDSASWQAGSAPRAQRCTRSACDLAYVIYTSGSTGIPKGVEITHRSLSNLIFWHQRTYSLTPRDRATQLAAPAFDACVWEIWPYLTCGASIHIPDEGTRDSPSKLLNWMAQHSITLCFLPTPLAEALLEETFPTGLALRALLTGGDKLRHAPREPLPFQLVNHYGPTETTVVATYAPVPSTPNAATPPPIGRPIANTRVYILDRNLQPVPMGVPGELCIAGDGLARRYRNRPELTAERFIRDPFDAQARRLYRTGDMARYLENGDIEFLGRRDQQVKIRGFRIELGEIEAALSRHPKVRECLAAVCPDPYRRSALVAYLVCDAPVSVAELRQFLRDKLPGYMLPSAFVMLDFLPRTPHGKLDRQALSAQAFSVPEKTGGFVAPGNHAEEMMAQIWREVLGIGRIGIHDDFFADLGGHSLLGTQLISRVRGVFQIDLPLRRLFEAPTVAALTREVSRSQPDARLPIIGRIRPQQEDLLAGVERLSDEEVDILLQDLSAEEEVSG